MRVLKFDGCVRNSIDEILNYICVKLHTFIHVQCMNDIVSMSLVDILYLLFERDLLFLRNWIFFTILKCCVLVPLSYRAVYSLSCLV